MDFFAFLLLWFGAPALVAALLTARLSRHRYGTLITGSVGVALALAAYWLIWFSSPTTPQQGESDAEMYLGHWFEPQWAQFLLFWSLISWGAGMLIGKAADALRHERRARA